jgi:hypothetical protein
MIKWIKRKILWWCFDVDEEIVEVGRDGRVLESNYIRIDIYRGEGGLAVETVIYNKKRDENIIGFHIVHDDEELGNKLSKIITAESIKAL